MDEAALRHMLEQVREGKVPVQRALERLKILPYDDLEFARLDTHRHLRRGFPEVVFCPGKTCQQVVKIVQRLAQTEGEVMATRVTPETFEAIRAAVPEAVYHEAARIVLVGEPGGIKNSSRYVLVVTAGTGDISAAEEAAVTVRVMGNRVERLYDVGVAGIHRLLHHQEVLVSANVVVVAAGMEGALPSVVAGLIDRPVIALPTSVGYGVGEHGLAALMGMLTSCVPGVAVVNIDNGFGAGYLAGLINRMDETK